MAKITRATVDSFSGAGQLAYMWDSSLPGFGVRDTPAGVKSFVLRYRLNGAQRIKVLGRVEVLELSDARDMAQGALATVRRGVDPFWKKPINTLADLAAEFQAGRKDELKGKTLKGYESLWAASILPVLGKRPADGLTDDDAATLRKRMADTPTTFNRCAALIVTAVKWWGLPIDAHPFKRVKRYKEHQRDRILTDDENQRVGATFAPYKAARRTGWRYIDLFCLLLLTGLRRDEWRLGRWEWLNWETQLYKMPDNKTGGRVVYLPDLAVIILRELHGAQRKPKTGFIFPSARKKSKAISWTWRQWDEMRRNLGLEGFWIHDMRRTAGSFAHSKAGLSQRQVADFLGHKRMETSSRYIHDGEKKKAADLAAGAVAAGWNQSPANP